MLAVALLAAGGLDPAGASAAKGERWKQQRAKKALCAKKRRPARRAGRCLARPKAHRFRPPAAPAPRPPATLAPAPQGMAFGFNDYSAETGLVGADRNASLMAAAGANVHRVGIDWRWAEPHDDDFRFEVYDEMYRTRLAHGIRPFFMIAFAPKWALDSGVTCDQWRGQDCTYPPARGKLAEWREFVGKVAARYPLAGGIEIWNEPNLHWFWEPRPEPARYTELLVEAHRAVKAVNRSMPVVSGGIGWRDITTPDGVSTADFLRAMYAGGARGHMDAIGIHPYTSTLFPSALRNAMDVARSVRNAHGDSTPFWATELGYSTTGPSPAWGFSGQQQADGLVSAYRTLASMEDVKVVTFHMLIESRPKSATDHQAGFGVMRRDLTPKPAYCALARERGRSPC
jgi:hypothetical protein